MKWTGFTKDIPDTNTSFRSSKREELGGLSTVKMTDRIGNDEIIIKTFAERYQKVIYNKTSKEEGGGNLVCVFVGDNRTPFSEYDSGDLIEKTIHYWGVEPETDLSKLFEKKLLVLPCPARILTASETATIKKFLAGERRLVLFSGTDTTIANSILRQLSSKLEILPYSFPGEYYNMSGRITPNQLAWWIGKPVGWIGVHHDYWNTASLVDWKGYGILYKDITTMSPFMESCEWEDGANASIIAWIGDYLHSNDLAAKVSAYNPSTDPTWTMAFTTTGTPFYPAGYFPFVHTATLSEWGAWMSTNSSNMPMYRILLPGHVPERTSFAGGQYTNWSDASYRGLTGSYLSYVTGERIVVGSFKPSWLTINYDPSDIDSWYKTKELSSWFLKAPLDYADLFNQGGYSPVLPCSFYCQLGTDGSGEVIQGP
jgi:hypothetical protein